MRQSKLANILFTYELARRLAGTGVTVNCRASGRGRDQPREQQWRAIWAAWKIAGTFMKSAGRGARTQVYLASSPEVEGVTGKYFIDSKEARSSDVSHDANLARRLWEVSAQMTGLPAT